MRSTSAGVARPFLDQSDGLGCHRKLNAIGHKAGSTFTNRRHFAQAG